MKKYVVIFILLVNVVVANAQITAAHFGVNGKVQSVKLSTYSFVEKFGEIERGEKYSDQIVEFNEQGFIIKRYIIGQMDHISSVTTYEYLLLEDGKIKEINEYVNETFSEEPILKFKTKFKYDESGNFIDKRLYQGYNGSLLKTSANISEILASDDNNDSIVSDDKYFPNHYIDLFSSDDGEEIKTKVEKVDQQNNWTKKIKFIGGKQSYGYERLITYF